MPYSETAFCARVNVEAHVCSFGTHESIWGAVTLYVDPVPLGDPVDGVVPVPVGEVVPVPVGEVVPVPVGEVVPVPVGGGPDFPFGAVVKDPEGGLRAEEDGGAGVALSTGKQTWASMAAALSIAVTARFIGPGSGRLIGGVGGVVGLVAGVVGVVGLGAGVVGLEPEVLGAVAEPDGVDPVCVVDPAELDPAAAELADPLAERAALDPEVGPEDDPEDDPVLDPLPDPLVVVAVWSVVSCA